MSNFALLLPPGLPALAVMVEKATYFVPDDGPADLDVKGAGYQFVGMLSFLEPFRELPQARAKDRTPSSATTASTSTSTSTSPTCPSAWSA